MTHTDIASPADVKIGVVQVIAVVECFTYGIVSDSIGLASQFSLFGISGAGKVFKVALIGGIV